MINIEKPHGDVVMIGKCFDEANSQTGVSGHFGDLLN